jgi:sporulation protein YlmC with PRC-barrel domain
MATEIPAPHGSRIIRAALVQNTPVKNPAGEVLGTIEDLVLDRREGRVAYVVLRHGAILGMGGTLFALPWAILRYRPEEDAYVVGLDADFFEKTPGFPPDNWPDDWANAVAPEFALPAEGTVKA